MTRPAEAWWRKAHGSSWVDDYVESIQQPVRVWMQDAIRSMAPFTTVMDLGCHCGVLMPFLLGASADAKVVGIDVSVEALRRAKQTYPYHTWILASVADWVPMLAKMGSHADIVVSSSCLEHISKSDIDSTLAAIAQVATRAIILQEVTVTPRMPEGASLSCGVPEWRHDYVKRLAVYGWTCTKKTWLDVTSGRPAAVMVFEPKGPA